MKNNFYITVTDVKNYAYCPKIIYFTHVLHLQEPKTEAMELGSQKHDETLITPLLKTLKTKKLLKNINLTSKTLKITGKLDYLAITKFGEYIPIEIKWSEPTPKGKPKRDHKLQLATYAILTEENYKTTIKRAAIYYKRAHKTTIIPLNPKLKQQAKNTINKIHKIIQNEQIPKTKQPKTKCENCGYQKICKEQY